MGMNGMKSIFFSMRGAAWVSLAVVCIALPMMVLHGQDSGRCGCSFEGVVRSEGWEIPGLKGAIPSNESDVITRSSNNQVAVRKLKPPATLTRVEYYHTKDDEGGGQLLVLDSRPVEMKEVYELSAHGHVFAYFVAGTWHTGDGSTASGYFNAWYSDESGSGRFSRFREVGYHIPTPPSWTKVKSDSPR